MPFRPDRLTANTVVYIRANASIDPTNQSASNNYRDHRVRNHLTRNSSGTQTSTASTLSGNSPTYFTSMMTGTVPFAWVKVTRKTEKLAGQNVDALGPTKTLSVYYGPTIVNG